MKRKKFKETLLEKLHQARVLKFEQENYQDIDEIKDNNEEKEKKTKENILSSQTMARLLAPTKAFENNQIKKKVSEVLIEETEEEKRERIAAIRRKFKEKNKQTLENLKKKNQDNIQKALETQQEENKRKEKYRLKLLNLLSEKRIAAVDANDQQQFEAFDDAIVLVETIPDATQLDANESEEEEYNDDYEEIDELIEDDGGLEETIEVKVDENHLDVLVPVGSGLYAVRNRSNSQIASIVKAENSYEKLVQSEVDKREVIRKRNDSIRQYQEKIIQHLQKLSAQRKTNDLLKKEKEERKKKRAQILSERLLQDMKKNQNDEMVESHITSKPSTNTKKTSINNIVAKPKVVKEENTKQQLSDENPKTISETATTKLIDRLTKPPKVNDENQSNSSIGTTLYRDFSDWKRKNKVSPETLVFTMTGWYPCVKQALLDRGWFQNIDSKSSFCDLKWTLRSNDINQETLQPWQLTNHFMKNIAITTKVGLLKSLQPLIWLADINIHEIVPRGYDLNLPEEIWAFCEDFKSQKVIGIFKQIFFDIIGHEYSPRLPIEDSCRILHVNDYLVNQGIFQCYCSILERLTLPFQSSYIDDQFKDMPDSSLSCITNLEWEVLCQYDLRLAYPSGLLISQDKLKSKVDKKLFHQISQTIKVSIPLGEDNFQRVIHLLSQCHKLEGPSQSLINGRSNLWIVKPAAKSRGRGIETFNDLHKLLKYCGIDSSRVTAPTLPISSEVENLTSMTYSSTQWIVQKYIENPMIIAKRKFDLRQWVLVTDWNPLTIYFYNEFYARLSVEEYTNSDITLDNPYIHLVNNSIGKNSENFHKVIETEYHDLLEGYMMSHDMFKNHIMRRMSKDNFTIDSTLEVEFERKIHDRMKDIVKWSLMCASEMIEHRKNSWELYGFDFMIDDNFSPWLIEINSSPACDYSTKVTERYVQKALVELLAVILDLRKWEVSNKAERGERPNLGGWECIYKGPLLEKPIASLGSNLALVGEGYKTVRKIASKPSFREVKTVSLENEDIRDTKGETSVSLHPQKMVKSTLRNSSVDKKSMKTTKKEFDFDDSDDESIEQTEHLDNNFDNQVPLESKTKFHLPTSGKAAIPVKVFNLDF